MGRYEVTQSQWEEIMGTNPSYNKVCYQCPVERVSWDDIQIFIEKLNGKYGLNYRLPTEAEWEYAARGGNLSNDYKYAGSSSMSSVGWYNDNSNNPVGQKQANELGLYDMSGNVAEWCGDRYGSDYYNVSVSSKPQGPVSGEDRVSRGGSWADLTNFMSVANRGMVNPNDMAAVLGFRLARDL